MGLVHAAAHPAANHEAQPSKHALLLSIVTAGEGLPYPFRQLFVVSQSATPVFESRQARDPAEGRTLRF